MLRNANVARIIATGIFVASIAPASSQELSAPALQLSQDDLANWSQMNAAFSQCVGAVNLGSDSTICRGIATYLQTFAGRVAIASKVAQTEAVPKNAPAVTPAPANANPAAHAD